MSIISKHWQCLNSTYAAACESFNEKPAFKSAKLLTGVGTPEEYGAHSIWFSRRQTFIVKRISLTSNKASHHSCKRKLFFKKTHTI